MKHLGDITKINGAEITPVDIITFGSPCQDLSVAGNRKGLSGERSGLFMEAVRIIKEMRNATKQLRMSGANDDIRLSPRIAIWENVPGAFSSNGGEDFRCVLEELARIENPEVSIPKPKKWMPSGCIELPCGCITWRTHDAQYWGVPQRRKRISLIVDFRDKPEPEIQLISRGMSGNIAESNNEGKETSGTFGKGFDATVTSEEPIIKPMCIGNGQLHDALTPSEKCKTLNTMDDPMKVVCVGNGQVSQLTESDKVGALNCMHDQQAIISPINIESAVCYGLDRASFNQGKNAKYDISITEDIAQPIVARGPGGGNADKVNALCARDFKGVGNQYVAEGKCIIQNLCGSQKTNPIGM